MRKVTSIGILIALSACLFATACSDDDDNPAVCGNGLVEGAEVCDQANLNGQSCTTVPGSFTGGTLSCTNACTFDTSQCTTGQEECGNGELETGESCDGSDLGTATCQTVGNYVGGTLGCTGTCTFDTSQCEPPASCGNGSIDTGEDCDGSNLNDQDCTTIGGGYSGGTLSCKSDCTFEESACTTTPPDCGNGTINAGEDCDGNNLDQKTCADVGPYEAGVGTLSCNTNCTFNTAQCVATPSGEIQIVIDHMGQTGLSLPISAAYVTYVTPGIGNLANDPPGFTLQSSQEGPAIFVAVNPTTLTPVPAVGDLVSLTVTETALVNSQPRVLALTSFARASQGNDITALAQDVTSSSDLVSALDSRASELITATVTITGAFAGAGQGYVAADVTTDAVTAAPLPKLRVLSTVQQFLGLHTGCMLTVSETPLWRFNAEAQIGVWQASDITVAVCDAPQVVSAVALSSTTVAITFDRAMDAASVLTDGTQFTISDGTNPLAVTAAALTDVAEVTITTATQVSMQPYTVTVASTVEDVFETGVDQTANTATFAGYESFGAQLYLWELDSDTPGTDAAEFIELWNNTGSAIDFSTEKLFLLFLNGNQTNDGVYFALQLTGTLAAGGLRVVGNPGVNGVAETFPGSSLQNGADGVLLVRCDACSNNASAEFVNSNNSFDVTTNLTFTTLTGATATKIDGIAYCREEADDAALMSKLGVTAQWSEGTTTSAANQSLGRVAPGVWTVGAPTPGTL
ncbi:MAG: Ig-like domain-containing protein [Polyangia bacterium]|jgi:hypothetical protein|nr:Ig-like domain-containing protein [Polyangia bacterium]